MADAKRDLSLAYSPGVAFPCLMIQANPEVSYEVTNRGNTVGVLTNGTAVLGMGNIGALASKPVMEGKVVLLKQLGDLDALDVEIDTTDPDRFVKTAALLEGSFGAINLEDIRAPDCFYIE